MVTIINKVETPKNVNQIHKMNSERCLIQNQCFSGILVDQVWISIVLEMEMQKAQNKL